MQQVLRYEVRKLFDPIQTHAAYGVPLEQVDRVKEVLRERGATRFRVQNTPSGLRIVCFKLKKAVDKTAG